MQVELPNGACRVMALPNIAAPITLSDAEDLIVALSQQIDDLEDSVSDLRSRLRDLETRHDREDEYEQEMAERCL